MVVDFGKSPTYWKKSVYAHMRWYFGQFEKKHWKDCIASIKGEEIFFFYKDIRFEIEEKCSSISRLPSRNEDEGLLDAVANVTIKIVAALELNEL